MARASLHDSSARAAMQARIARLRPDSARQWGRMDVSQMLWHLNAALSAAVGDLPCEPKPVPIPRGLMKWLVLRMPWPKGKAPTAKEFLARGTYDFEAERKRLLTLLDRLAKVDVKKPWPAHPAFGNMTGREWSELQYKHMDHHFRQFGV